MIPLFERAKTVHALDRAVTVIGETQIASLNKLQIYVFVLIIDIICVVYSSLYILVLNHIIKLYAMKTYTEPRH
jgi:hypothetical protein